MVVFCDRDDDGLINVHYKAREQSFDLDRVFDSMISQEEVRLKWYLCGEPETWIMMLMA